MPLIFGKTIVAAIAAASLAHAPQDQGASIQQGQEAPVQESAPTQQAKNTFNPQISLVTDFRWNAVDSDKTVRKRGFLKEAELGLASDVDPFLRAEAYISFSDEDGESKAEVEEGFARYNNLAPGLSAKFGKIAAAIGRVQRNHADQLNWLDYPMMVEDYLGADGLRSGGGSLSYLIPGARFNELTLEVLDSHDKGIFAGGSAGAPVVVGAYRTFLDFNEDSSAQVGLSYASGPSPVPGTRSDLIAAEFTYKWVPGDPGRSLNFETEGYWGKQGGDDERKFGGFAAVTYEVRPRLFLYAKYDYSEIPGGSEIHKGPSLGATLKVTEFHHWRAEFQRIESNFADPRNVLNVQFQWVIGAHPAHKY
ncbi:MAG: hypothetical protein JSS66_17585 [Armatimonadetes bacterium]|nr:hypothetical protein [Armatimonadota bacterium]